jgi:DNA-binding beta-propeller fold protein YncE
MKGSRGVAALVAVAVAFAATPAQGASGTFDFTWGKDVIQAGHPGDTGTGFEICSVAADCKFGLIVGELGGELAQPAQVAVDSAANFVYVADEGHDRVQKFTSAGTFLRTWGKDVINGSGSGSLEVCSVAASCQAGAPGGLGGEMNSPEGVAVDSVGNVYVSERLNNRIEKFSAIGGFIAAWGKDVVTGGSTGFEVCTVPANCKAGVAGGLGGEFNSPNGITSDGTFIYVADRVNDRIQKFDQNGVFQRAWGKDVVSGGATGAEVCTVAANCKAGAASTGLGGELNTPVALAPDGTGNVYVADTNGSQVQKFSDLGTWDRTWGKDVVAGGSTGPEVCTAAASCQAGDNSTALGGEFNQPNGIAADSTTILVSDPYNERIQEFDPSGRFFLTWGKDTDVGGGSGFETCSVSASCKQGASGGLGGEMQLPAGLSLDAGSKVYVVDGGNTRIQRFGVEAPVFPPATSPPSTSPPQVKKKCKRKKHKRSAESAKKKKCKKKRKK